LNSFERTKGNDVDTLRSKHIAEFSKRRTAPQMIFVFNVL